MKAVLDFGVTLPRQKNVIVTKLFSQIQDNFDKFDEKKEKKGNYLHQVK